VQLSTLGGVESNAIAFPTKPVLRIKTTTRQLKNFLTLEAFISSPYSSLLPLARITDQVKYFLLRLPVTDYVVTGSHLKIGS